MAINRKHVREAVAYARRLGIRDAVVTRRSRHEFIVGTLPSGKPLWLPIPARPDPSRGMRNIQADLRRAART